MIIIGRYPFAYSEEELNELFWRYDNKEDCRLSRQALKGAFKELGAFFPCYRANRALHFADEDGDGYISEHEIDLLLDYTSQFHYINPSRLKYLFGPSKPFMKDGGLSRKELYDVFQRLGAIFPSYRATRALNYADFNRDGYICEEEEVDQPAIYIKKAGYKSFNRLL